MPPNPVKTSGSKVTARSDAGVTSDDYLESEIDERKELLDERKKDRKASISKHREAIESDDEFDHDTNTDGGEDSNEVIGGPGSDTEISKVGENFSDESVKESDKIVDEKFGVNDLRTRQEL